MDQSSVNYLAVLVAAVAGMVSGAIWYGVFAKAWMNAAGVTEEEARGGSKFIYLIAILAQLVIAIMLAVLFGHFADVDVMVGMQAAFFLWLGFCLAPMAVNHRFQGKGWDLTVIDGGYWLLVFLLQGALIAWMGA